MSVGEGLGVRAVAAMVAMIAAAAGSLFSSSGCSSSQGLQCKDAAGSFAQTCSGGYALQICADVDHNNCYFKSGGYRMGQVCASCDPSEVDINCYQGAVVACGGAGSSSGGSSGGVGSSSGTSYACSAGYAPAGYQCTVAGSYACNSQSCCPASTPYLCGNGCYQSNTAAACASGCIDCGGAGSSGGSGGSSSGSVSCSAQYIPPNYVCNNSSYLPCTSQWCCPPGYPYYCPSYASGQECSASPCTTGSCTTCQ